tara:strand:+ start:316 stop:1638 length:1323 start_codon:yes stop_codon:yes gene_type:complete
MARRPFFSGNYGSALGSTANAANLIARAGETQGQMLANLGSQIGGMIQQYGLNKEKRAKLTGEIEAYYKENPEALSQIGMSGDEAQDKKDFAERERFVKGDMSMAQLEGYAGKLARGEVLRSKKLQDDARRTLNETNKFNLALAQELKDANIKLKQNEALTSDIGVAVARMKQEDFEAIRDPALKEKLAQLRDAAGVRAADPASVQAGDERKLRKFQLSALERVDNIESLVADTLGLEKMAEMKIEDMKVLSETNKAKLESTKALSSYYKAKRLADLITAANKNSPSFKEQFKPIVELQGTILSKTVEVPGENKMVKFSEYLDLHKKDSDRYPMTGLAGGLNAQFQSLDLSLQNLLREQKVKVNVPDEPQANATPTSANSISQDYDYSNLDPSVAGMMAGPSAKPLQITDLATINMLKAGGKFRGKTYEELLAEGAIREQ